MKCLSVCEPTQNNMLTMYEEETKRRREEKERMREEKERMREEEEKKLIKKVNNLTNQVKKVNELTDQVKKENVQLKDEVNRLRRKTEESRCLIL